MDKVTTTFRGILKQVVETFSIVFTAAALTSYLLRGDGRIESAALIAGFLATLQFLYWFFPVLFRAGVAGNQFHRY